MRKTAWVDSSNQKHIIINDQAYDDLMIYKQISKDTPESGGMIFGLIRGEHLEVTGITHPEPTDIRTRYNVIRKLQGHYKKVMAIRKKTKNKVVYLGEWHTHPEKIPTPSNPDKATWVDFNKSSKHSILSIIVGTESLYIGVTKDLKLHKYSEVN